MVALVALAVVGGIVLGWLEVARIRRHGGRPLAMVAVVAGVVGAMVSILPGVVPGDLTLPVFLGCLIVVIRPREVIRATGGPRPAWEALRRGRELEVLVAEAGGPLAAREDEAITGRVEALSELPADPVTDEYVRLLRRTVVGDPADPGIAADLRALAKADAALRSMLAVAPIWEPVFAARLEAAAG